MSGNQKKKSAVFYMGRVLSGVRLPELNRALAQAHKRCGKSKAWLFCDMLQCAARYGAGYHDYVMFGFYEMDHAHRDTYVTRLRNKRMIVQLNEENAADDFDKKTRFYPRFQEYLGRDFLLVSKMKQEEFSRFLKGKQELFAKPDVGESGKGIEKLTVADYPNEKALFDYIKKKHFGVIEGRLEQHADMNALYPHSVNSLRVVTLVTGQGEDRQAHCVYAVVKMGNSGKFVDNLENGGMFCPLDQETGEITGVAHTSALTTFKIHPYTGVPLLGYRVPFVKEAIAQCKKAAMVEEKMRFVGWDVCITSTGPAIIEGNDYPGYDFWQQPEHTPDHIGLWPYYQKMLPELKL